MATAMVTDMAMVTADTENMAGTADTANMELMQIIHITTGKNLRRNKRIME